MHFGTKRLCMYTGRPAAQTLMRLPSIFGTAMCHLFMSHILVLQQPDVSYQLIPHLSSPQMAMQQRQQQQQQQRQLTFPSIACISQASSSLSTFFCTALVCRNLLKPSLEVTERVCSSPFKDTMQRQRQRPACLVSAQTSRMLQLLDASPLSAGLCGDCWTWASVCIAMHGHHAAAVAAAAAAQLPKGRQMRT